MEEKKEHFVRPTTERPPSLVSLTLLAVIFGLAAGFGGYLVGKWLIPSNLTFLSNQPDIKINLEQPLTSVANKYDASIAGLYHAGKVIVGIDGPIFDRADYLGSAVAVTSDGWLMTTDQVLLTAQAKVVINDKVYDIDQIKKDVFSGAIFVKIKTANLLAVNFQLTEGVKVGERIFTDQELANSLNHSFSTAVLGNIHFTTGAYLSTDSIDYYYQLADLSDSSLSMASPYFNLKGDLIGLSYKINQQVVLLPADYLKQAVKHLLDNTERPIWGISYIDLENNSGLEQKGNYIYNVVLNKAVLLNSPSYKAGLKPKDRIISINNDAVTKDRTITAILQNYRLGDKIILKVVRDNKEIDLEIK